MTSCADNYRAKNRETLESIKISDEQNGSNWSYEEVGKGHLATLMMRLCSTKDLEFIDLYPVLDSIASDNFENLILVDSLKTKGFKVTTWSRGNWQDGPRIVSLTLSNDECDCQVDKLYYSTEEEGKYKVAERIKCERVSR